jgi:hypothetical protein
MKNLFLTLLMLVSVNMYSQCYWINYVKEVNKPEHHFDNEPKIIKIFDEKIYSISLCENQEYPHSIMFHMADNTIYTYPILFKDNNMFVIYMEDAEIVIIKENNGLEFTIEGFTWVVIFITSWED